MFFWEVVFQKNKAHINHTSVDICEMCVDSLLDENSNCVLVRLYNWHRWHFRDICMRKTINITNLKMTNVLFTRSIHDRCFCVHILCTPFWMPLKQCNILLLRARAASFSVANAWKTMKVDTERTCTKGWSSEPKRDWDVDECAVEVRDVVAALALADVVATLVVAEAAPRTTFEPPLAMTSELVDVAPRLARFPVERVDCCNNRWEKTNKTSFKYSNYTKLDDGSKANDSNTSPDASKPGWPLLKTLFFAKENNYIQCFVKNNKIVTRVVVRSRTNSSRGDNSWSYWNDMMYTMNNKLSPPPSWQKYKTLYEKSIITCNWRGIEESRWIEPSPRGAVRYYRYMIHSYGVWQRKW